MYRFLLNRRWFGGLALAVVAAICCLLLARWQWHRREARLERNAIITTNWDRPPAALPQVVPEREAVLPSSRQWTPVDLTGTYLPQGTTLIRNRPLDGEPGYRVLVPLRTAAGILYIDRGWLPTGQTGARPDDVPAPPAGQVEVIARVRPAEPSSSKTAPDGQAQSATPANLLPRLRDTTRITDPVYTGTYALMASEDPAAARSMPVFAEPERDEGPHLSYAIQWVVFALMFLGMWVVVVRREAEDQDDEFAPARPPRPPGAVRDEDIEDAQVDQLLGDSGSRARFD